MTTRSLVENLPEVYQPIYGHPELDPKASRPCHDRLQFVLLVHDQLAEQTRRSIRVLDLGCAQGYFSFQLAERGATVVGIDRLAANIELCQRLSTEQPHLSVRFSVESIEDVVLRLQPGEVDLVLGLSVLHHLCAETGAEETRSILKILSTKVDIGLFEVALREEPIAWAAAQPETPDWLYQDFSFLASLGEFDTHLSEHKRPLYFASNVCWFDRKKVSRFQSWTSRAHELDQPGDSRGRRYFETDDQLMKLFRFHGKFGESNRKELEREISFLSRSDITAFGYPQLFGYNLGKHEGWILRERLQGQRLSTALFKAENFDRESIIASLLKQLMELESRNLFHEDLRAWNILIAAGGRSTLIDYGSITSARADHEFRQDWRLPFLILLDQIFHPSKLSTWPPRLDELHPDQFPESVSNLVWKLWNSEADAWTWGKIAFEWSRHKSESIVPNRGTLKEILQVESNANEIKSLKSRVAILEAEVNATRDRLSKWDQRLAFLKPFFRLMNLLLPARNCVRQNPQSEGALLRVVLCPVCKEDEGHAYSGPGALVNTAFHLLECSACGSVFSDPMPTDTQLAQVYGHEFDYRWYADHFSAKLKDCILRVEQYRPLLGKRILDFGGGMGYLSVALREAGFESLTYDPYVPGESPGQGTWDTVIGLHVLEHSNNLERTISEIKSLLRPEGRIILAVPNRASTGYQKLGMDWVWAQPPLIHIFHFTAEGLIALLTRLGFKNIQISYHERWDANFHADVLHAKHFRRWDAAWNFRLLRVVPGYRKLIAAINSRRRFRSLSKCPAMPIEHRSELQVSATLCSS